MKLYIPIRVIAIETRNGLTHTDMTHFSDHRGLMRISYSHSSEDIILRRIFSDVQRGFYIDVGAYHPTDDSVTKTFYDEGWSGINIEPNPEFFSLLERDRPNDLNLEMAVSDSKGTQNLYVVGHTGLSSLKSEIATQAVCGSDPAVDAKEFRTIAVQTDKLSNIWDRYIPPHQDVQFLKIDVEGGEKDTIAGCDFRRHRPWVLVIESTVPRTSTLVHHTWEPLILEAGYLYAFFDGLNRYYVAKEKEILLSLFDRPPNPVVDNFKPFMAYLIERNATQQIDSLVKEKNTLKDDVDKLTGRNISLTREIEELNESIENLNERNRLLMRDISGLEQRLKSSLLKNDELAKRTDELLAGMACTVSRMSEKLSLLSVQQRVLLQPNLFKPSNAIKRRLNEIDVDDVDAAFSLLLRRRPESLSTVQYHLDFQTIDRLLEVLVSSEEFKKRESRSQSSFLAGLVSYIQTGWRRLEEAIGGFGGGNSVSRDARLSNREKYYLSKLRAK